MHCLSICQEWKKWVSSKPGKRIDFRKWSCVLFYLVIQEIDSLFLCLFPKIRWWKLKRTDGTLFWKDIIKDQEKTNLDLNSVKMLLNVLIQDNIKLRCKSGGFWKKPKNSNLWAVIVKFGVLGYLVYYNSYKLVPKLFKEFWLKDLTLGNSTFKSFWFSFFSIISQVLIQWN